MASKSPRPSSGPGARVPGPQQGIRSLPTPDEIIGDYRIAVQQPPGEPDRAQGGARPARPSSASSATARRWRSSPWRAPSARATSAPATTATRPSCSRSALLTLRGVLRAALRRTPTSSAEPGLGRPLDDRALRDAPARRRRHAGSSSTERLQLVGRRLAHRRRRCRAWSAWPRPRASTASSSELHGLRPSFSHHGDEVAFGTIGNASCAEGMFWEAVNAVGVLQVPDAALDLGRRLRHLGAQRVPDHEGRPLRACSTASSASARATAGLRPLHASRAGTTRRCARPTSPRRRSCAREHVPGDRPRHRADAAAGPLDLRQPRALQDAGAAGVGARVRLPAARCASGCSRRASPRRRSSTRIEEEEQRIVRDARAPRLGGLSSPDRRGARELSRLLDDRGRERARARGELERRSAASCERKRRSARDLLRAAPRRAGRRARARRDRGRSLALAARAARARTRALRLAPLQRSPPSRRSRCRRCRPSYTPDCAGAQRLRDPQRLLRRRARAAIRA